MDKKDEMLDQVKEFEKFSKPIQKLIEATMLQLNVLGAVTDGFRGVGSEDRKLALSALDFLHHNAPTRHKKAQLLVMKEAVERFWFEKDNNLLPSPKDPPPTIMH